VKDEEGKFVGAGSPRPEEIFTRIDRIFRKSKIGKNCRGVVFPLSTGETGKPASTKRLRDNKKNKE